MAIVKDDIILASDVTELQYFTETTGIYELSAPWIDAVSKHWYRYYPLPPGHKLHLNTIVYQKGVTEGTLQWTVSTRVVGSDTWTEVGTYHDDSIYITNLDRDIKELKIDIYMSIPGGNWGAVSKLRFRNAEFITQGIAVSGSPVRVLNELFTEWLPKGGTKVTTELYNAGRLGYVD